MSLVNRSRWAWGVLVLLLAGVAAYSGDGKVAITLTNDDTNDILVTVYDMNTRPHSVLLVDERLGGFSSLPISVAADANGRGHVYWNAKSAEQDGRQCGQKDKPSLSDGATLHVYGHSACPLPVPANVAPHRRNSNGD